MPEENAKPLFSVVRGEPNEEEIAALTAAVLLQQHGADAKPSSGPRAGVGRLFVRRRQIGAELAPGPGSWRRARPR